MPFHVYVLRSRTGRRYIGQTENLQRRLREHNEGRNHATKHDTQWKLLYAESYQTRRDAMKRERWLKSGAGRDWLRKNIAGWSPPQAE